MKKQIFHILLLLIIPYFTACQQNVKVEVKDNCIYVNGKKILEGDDDSITETIFMEKQNKIVYIKQLESSENSFSGYDETLSGIYAYDVQTKETEQIVSHREMECADMMSLQGLDDCFYFEVSDMRWIYTHKYSFKTRKTTFITLGSLIDVIKTGKYQNCIVVNETKQLDYSHFKYYERWILDNNENPIGCLGYEFEDYFLEGKPFPNTESGYDNVTFVEPPHFDLAKDLNEWSDLAKNGLSYIRQYQQGDKSVENEIESAKKRWDGYKSVYLWIMHDEIEALSQQQKEQLIEIKRFQTNYENYK